MRPVQDSEVHRDALSPSLSWLEDGTQKAFAGIINLVVEALRDMKDCGELFPNIGIRFNPTRLIVPRFSEYPELLRELLKIICKRSLQHTLYDFVL